MMDDKIYGRIEKLISEHRKIWFFVKPEDVEAFTDLMNQFEATFADGSRLSKENCRQFMALDQNRKLAFVSAMAWAAAEHKGDGTEGVVHEFEAVPRISFEDLRNENYVSETWGCECDYMANEDFDEDEEASSMTIREICRLMDWLQSKGMGYEEIIDCIRYIGAAE